LADERFPVEASHIMMFARSIGETNPIYFDAEYAATTEVGAVIAPPTFTQSGVQFQDQFVLRPIPGRHWFGSGKEPSGSNGPKAAPAGGGGGDAFGQMATILHAEQHFEYKRPLRAGDQLTSRPGVGNSWEKVNRSGKTLKFSEQVTEFVDQSGEVVVVSRGVSVNTGG
jgi:hypothetical protein